MAKRRKGPTMIQASRRLAPEVKALFHQVLGAGKRHVKRQFVGLTDEDARLVRARLEAAIRKRIENA